MAVTTRLRIYVNVPQPYAPFIKLGGAAQLRIAENHAVYPAKVISTAGALDQNSRTLLTQLEVDNAAGLIRPGSYGEVEFEFTSAGNAVRIPANSLLFRTEGLSVVTIDSQNRMLIKPIQVGRDLGKEIEVISGIELDDRIVINPPDSARTGTSVRVSESPRPI